MRELLKRYYKIGKWCCSKGIGVAATGSDVTSSGKDVVVTGKGVAATRIGVAATGIPSTQSDSFKAFILGYFPQFKFAKY